MAQAERQRRVRCRRAGGRRGVERADLLGGLRGHDRAAADPLLTDGPLRRVHVPHAVLLRTEVALVEQGRHFDGVELGRGEVERVVRGDCREAAKRAFGGLLAGAALTAGQIEFVNQIIDHLTEHGVMSATLLYETPFTDLASRGPDGLFSAPQVRDLLAILEGVNWATTAA